MWNTCFIVNLLALVWASLVLAFLVRLCTQAFADYRVLGAAEGRGGGGWGAAAGAKEDEEDGVKFSPCPLTRHPEEKQ